MLMSIKYTHFLAKFRRILCLKLYLIIFLLSDQFGETPAMAAARNNRWDIVEYLLRERSIVTDTPNRYGQTLQYMATTFASTRSNIEAAKSQIVILDMCSPL